MKFLQYVQTFEFFNLCTHAATLGASSILWHAFRAINDIRTIDAIYEEIFKLVNSDQIETIKKITQIISFIEEFTWKYQSTAVDSFEQKIVN